jgi:hypothetical protein
MIAFAHFDFPTCSFQADKSWANVRYAAKLSLPVFPVNRLVSEKWKNFLFHILVKVTQKACRRIFIVYIRMGTLRDSRESNINKLLQACLVVHNYAYFKRLSSRTGDFIPKTLTGFISRFGSISTVRIYRTPRFCCVLLVSAGPLKPALFFWRTDLEQMPCFLFFLVPTCSNSHRLRASL